MNKCGMRTLITLKQSTVETALHVVFVRIFRVPRKAGDQKVSTLVGRHELLQRKCLNTIYYCNSLTSNSLIAFETGTRLMAASLLS